MGTLLIMATKKKPDDPTARLDAFGVDAMCEQICAGVSQTEIAKKLRVGIATLCRWIAADLERSARVREARISAARTFDEKAELVLKGAKNVFQLAKARELASHYRWKASKFSPRDFGDKLEIEQRTTITDLTDEQLDAKLAQLAGQGAKAGAAGVAGGKGKAQGPEQAA